MPMLDDQVTENSSKGKQSLSRYYNYIFYDEVLKVCGNENKQ